MKKGFTLIEVLGVIVVLAVIALITTPIIMNVIEKAKKGALEDSAYGLLDSANIYYASGILDETSSKTEFTFSDGVQTSESKLSYKGKVENGSVRLYSDGKSALCITGGEYAALKNVNDKKVSVTRGRCSYNSETEEYETRGLCQDLQDEIDELKKKHQEELDKLKEEYEEKIKQAGSDKEQLIKDYEAQIKTITEAYETQIKELQDQLNVFKKGGTATADQILAGKTAFVKGNLITGTMVNRGAIGTITSLELSGTNELRFRFEPGYYPSENYNGIRNPYIYASQSQVSSAIGLNANKIAKNQTVMGIAGTFTSDANATAAGILAGQTAYVNGNKITGTMVNRGAVNATINPGESYTIPAGYHNGQGTVQSKTTVALYTIPYLYFYGSAGDPSHGYIDFDVSAYNQVTVEKITGGNRIDGKANTILEFNDTTLFNNKGVTNALENYVFDCSQIDTLRIFYFTSYGTITLTNIRFS